MSAGSVRAGKAFVEISADDTDFQRGMKRAQHGMARLANMMRQMGTGLTMAGAAIGLPMVLAARQAATFEDALLELKGSVSDISPAQMKAVRDEALRLSREMGVAPEKIGQAFALLIKAGLSVDDALAGAAKSAVEFARVSGVDAQEAATFMKVAMNVFGTSAAEAVDTLSAAADASETDIRHMVEAFSLVGSAGKTFQQSLFGVSQAFAALARYGIQGEEAGTGVKVLLSRLVAPSKEAEKALGVLGLSVQSFRDAEGGLLPIVQIVDIISRQMKGMSKEARGMILSQKALVDVFGDRGIKVISAFADMGMDGFNQLADSMESNRTVAEKFSIAMSGITGSFERLHSAVQRLAIAFMVGAAPALAAFAYAATPVMDFLAFLFTKIPVISPALAVMAATMTGLGVAILVTGGLMQFLNFGSKGFINFGLIWGRVVKSMTLAVGGLSRALAALRVAMLMIPGWGWALAAIAAAGGIAAWMMSSSSETTKAANKSGIKRDDLRKPLAEPLAGGAGGVAGRGEALGTFSGFAAGQLGIGPALSAAEETAENTRRAAEGIEEMLQQERIPKAGLWAEAFAGAGAGPGGAPIAVANGNNDLLSANERSALATEQARDYLRQILERSRSGGLAFA